jgi:hypothetical protein
VNAVAAPEYVVLLRFESFSGVALCREWITALFDREIYG